MRQTSLALALGVAFTALAHAETLPEYTADTIVVTPTRSPEKASAVISDISVITAKDIAAAGQTTLVELLQAQPGVELKQSGGPGSQASVFIRGGNGGHTLVLVDGLRVGSATTGTTPLENISLDQVERIEILRGPASSLYGADAIAGVIQIFTKQGRGAPKPSATVGAGSYGLVQGQASYGGESGDTRFNLGAGYSRTRGGFSAARPGIYGYNPDKDGDIRRSAHLNVDHAIDGRNHVGLTAMGNRDNVDFDDGTAKDVAHNQVNDLAAYWKSRVSDIWTSQLRAGLGQNHTENFSLGIPTSRFDTDQAQYLWQNDFALDIGNLTASLEHNDQRVSATTAFTETSRTIDAGQVGYLGQWGPHTLQASLRHDDYSDFGGHTTGMAGYAYALNAAWRASASYATSFKAPTFNDMYWPNQYGFQGNPDLKPEQGRNLEMSLRYQQGLNRASVTAYRNRVSDLIVYVPAFPVSTMANVDRATLEGITLAGGTELAGLRIRASMDWLQATDDATGHLLSYRARRHGSLDVSKALDRWTLGATLVASGPRFADSANTVSLPGYARLDVRAQYRINPDWDVLMRVNNVLDADYQLVAGYDTSFQLVPAYNTPGVNGLVALQYHPR
ncbi:MAG: TonB-dependent receptor [Betaproteobacteria bacterium]|nr:TonB-dependent receptor [Betaproteobacteria bacterium]